MGIRGQIFSDAEIIAALRFAKDKDLAAELVRCSSGSMNKRLRESTIVGKAWEDIKQEKEAQKNWIRQQWLSQRYELMGKAQKYIEYDGDIQAIIEDEHPFPELEI